MWSLVGFFARLCVRLLIDLRLRLLRHRAEPTGGAPHSASIPESAIGSQLCVRVLCDSDSCDCDVVSITNYVQGGRREGDRRSIAVPAIATVPGCRRRGGSRSITVSATVMWFRLLMCQAFAVKANAGRTHCPSILIFTGLDFEIPL